MRDPDPWTNVIQVPRQSVAGVGHGKSQHVAGLLLQAVQQRVQELAVFLGEPPDSDPAAIFSLVWAFAQAFDVAYLAVAKRHQAETAKTAGKPPTGKLQATRSDVAGKHKNGGTHKLPTNGEKEQPGSGNKESSPRENESLANGGPPIKAGQGSPGDSRQSGPPLPGEGAHHAPVIPARG